MSDTPHARGPSWARRLGGTLFLGWAALAPLAAAQTQIELKGMPAGRGQTQLGEGGVSGAPPSAIEGLTGASVAYVDLNGDGLDDLVIGAPGLPTVPLSGVLDEAGHVFVIFGTSDLGLPGGTAEVDVTNIVMGQGFDFIGSPGDRAGSSLANAGDVNNDGIEDLIIGVPGHDVPGRVDAGGAYIIFGRLNYTTYPPNNLLSAFSGSISATLLEGATALGAAGLDVGGGADANNDGLDDVILGAPLESTNGHLQNGTASIVYGSAAWPAQNTVDLATLGAGGITVVHGQHDFQLVGQSVAGLGRFDPVLPNSGLEDLVNGDEFAIGAPGSNLGAGFFEGAAYVLRGEAAAVPATSYLTSDFGPGNSAGLVYPGGTAGDQAGSFVAAADDMFGSDGFVELLVAAPFDDGLGVTDVGALYVVPGRLGVVNPAGFDLGLVGDPSIDAVRILGPVINDGRLGVVGAPAGDFDRDGFIDLAVGFANAGVLSGPTVFGAAGQVHLLDGVLVDPFVDRTLNLATEAATTRLLLLEGEAGAARVGGSLAAGDANGDGDVDLAIGAPGAASNPNPGDPTGLAFTKTGRSHVVYGPLSRVCSLSPPSGYFDGPTVDIEVFNLAADGNPGASFGGVPATVVSVVPSTNSETGTLTVAPPAPMAPGAGATVDVMVTSDQGSGTLTSAFTYIPLSVTSGPEPSEVLGGTSVDFTGVSFSNAGDMLVTFNGAGATVTASDPLAGTMTATVPLGLPQQVPLDVIISNSNGLDMADVKLTVQPFVVDNVSPNIAPQDAGVDAPVGTPGLSYFGEPPVEVTVTLITETGLAPPETEIYFGRDDLVFKRAPPVAINGADVVVEVPALLVGQTDTVVDVRVVTNANTVTLPGSFTYVGGDFREIFDTASAGHGESFPECVMAGLFEPSTQSLLVLRGHPVPETQFGALVIGFELFDPLAPFFGGLLGPIPGEFLFLPIAGLEEVSLQANHDEFLAPEGAKLYLQFITQEFDGVTTRYGHSPILEMTVDIP